MTRDMFSSNWKTVCVGHDFPEGQFVSVRTFLIAATIWYSGFFLLSIVILRVTLTNWQRFGLEFHLRSSPSAFSGYTLDISRPADYFITCYTLLTRPNKVETAVLLGFQFGLYRVVAPLNFLRSISLASFFTSLFFWLIRSFTDPS